MTSLSLRNGLRKNRKSPSKCTGQMCLICMSEIESLAPGHSHSYTLSTRIFTACCRVLKIDMTDPLLQWNFQKEKLPFCKECLANLSELAALCNQLECIQTSINKIEKETKIKIIRTTSTKKCRTFNRNSLRHTYFRNMAVKDFKPIVALLELQEEPANREGYTTVAKRKLEANNVTAGCINKKILKLSYKSFEDVEYESDVIPEYDGDNAEPRPVPNKGSDTTPNGQINVAFASTDDNINVPVNNDVEQCKDVKENNASPEALPDLLAQDCNSTPESTKADTANNLFSEDSKKTDVVALAVSPDCTIKKVENDYKAKDPSSEDANSSSDSDSSDSSTIASEKSRSEYDTDFEDIVYKKRSRQTKRPHRTRTSFSEKSNSASEDRESKKKSTQDDQEKEKSNSVKSLRPIMISDDKWMYRGVEYVVVKGGYQCCICACIRKSSYYMETHVILSHINR